MQFQKSPTVPTTLCRLYINSELIVYSTRETSSGLNLQVTAHWGEWQCWRPLPCFSSQNLKHKKVWAGAAICSSHPPLLSASLSSRDEDLVEQVSIKTKINIPVIIPKWFSSSGKPLGLLYQLSRGVSQEVIAIMNS